MNIKHSFFMLFALPFLTACEQDRIPDTCHDSPKFCINLHEDSWCRAEREFLIDARQAHTRDADDVKAYTLMVALQDYQQCLEPLLAMEYTRRKERKEQKLNAIIDAKEHLAQLTEQTQDSDYPYLLLWRWQHQADHQAKARFIALAERADMRQAILQKNLAKFLMARDSEAAEIALQRALALSQHEAELDIDIIAQLIALYVRQQDYQKVWVWSRVFNQLKSEETVDLARMDSYTTFSASEQQTMLVHVERLIEQLTHQNYKLPAKAAW